MAMGLHAAVVPPVSAALANLAGILAKGQAFCAAKGVDEAVMLATRLTPDMFALSRQVQIACDVGKIGAARLAGAEWPKHADDETTFQALIDRIASVRAFLADLPADTIDARAAAVLDITMGRPPNQRHITPIARDFAFNWVKPNVYFHCTTAYAILRQAGAEIGKADFLGS